MHMVHYTVVMRFLSYKNLTITNNVLEETMSKKTRLEEDAAIYQKRDRQSEKEKLKDMPLKKKFSYLWDYYRYHALFSILIFAFIFYVVYTFVKPKIETMLYAAIINNTIDPHIWDEYTEKATEYLELNTQSEDVVLNYSFYFDGASEYTIGMRQTFGVYLATTEIDIIIAPMSEFISYVENDFFTPLSDHLPTDLYSSLADKLYLSGTVDNPKVAAYGLYMQDTKLYRENSFDTDDPIVLGIVTNSKYKENAVKFIRYLFSER